MMELSNIENIIILNWNRICRICLNTELTLSHIIYFDERYKMTYKDMINTCASVNMSPDDDFPQLICSCCIEQLSTAYEFNTKCNSSHNMLTKLLERKKDSINEIKCEENERNDSVDYFQEQTDAKDVFEIEVKNESTEITNLALCDKTSKSTSDEFHSECKSLHDNNPTLKVAKKSHTKSKVEILTKCKTINNKHMCPICNTSYSGRGIRSHRKSHINTCWKCVIVLNNQDEYDEHMKIHTRKDCTECGKVFETRNKYTKHMDIHTKDKHLCMICGKNFSLISSLNAHIRIHTGEKRFKCTHCEKTYLHWGDRRQHIMSFHTKEKPHECHFCKKRFINSRHLVVHLRTHTGEKPYPCKLCDMKFIASHSLKMHMYKHTGERKVICQICNKGFTKNYNLKLHMVTHTGERNHLCLVCGKAFTQAHVLRGHMKTHPEQIQPSKSVNKA